MAIHIDRVCGARVDESAALVQADFSEREGRRYVFCSMDCKREFDRNPQAYAAPRDPVCGKEVDPEEAQPRQLVASHEGKRFYFCSSECRQDFTNAPAFFAGHAPHPPEYEGNEDWQP